MFVAYVDDLFFGSKIEDLAKTVGASVQLTGSKVELRQLIDQGMVTHVLLDLRITDEEVLNVVGGVPNVAGFGPHVERERFSTARNGGVKTVWANSALANRLPGWLQKRL